MTAPRDQSVALRRQQLSQRGLALFSSGLVALVEDTQQFRMGIEHARIEIRGDLIGMRRYDRCSCLHYAERLR